MSLDEGQWGKGAFRDERSAEMMNFAWHNGHEIDVKSWSLWSNMSLTQRWSKVRYLVAQILMRTL